MEDYKRKYEQALDNFKKIKAANKDNKELVDFIEYKYPELKESEDEKIRQYVIKVVYEWWDRCNDPSPEFPTKEKMIAWLEKQEDTNKEYWRGYREGKQEIIDKYSELEKQGEQKPNFCHHEVDLSDCSEEYRKAYYDGWNNCNQQHAQLEAEQKPAWSEEDEKQARQIERIVHNAGCSQKLQEQITDWLKSIKERMKGE